MLTKAFFPAELSQDAIVYDLALRDPDSREILESVSIHELGHVLGL